MTQSSIVTKKDTKPGHIYNYLQGASCANTWQTWHKAVLSARKIPNWTKFTIIYETSRTIHEGQAENRKKIVTRKTNISDTGGKFWEDDECWHFFRLVAFFPIYSTSVWNSKIKLRGTVGANDLQARCRWCRPSNSVEALNGVWTELCLHYGKPYPNAGSYSMANV